ncbi:MAG TPA: hypothetical protein VFH51_02180, partial [Myxococcota bacterium]|nr:hypothetical protein [Myxococcota bacterium]
MTPKLYAALKWGALLGGALAIFETWGWLVTTGTQNQADASIAWCFNLVLEGVIPLAAGVLAARATGERRSGLIAGLTAGAIVACVNIIAEIVFPPNLTASAPDSVPLTTFDVIVLWIEARLITLG